VTCDEHEQILERWQGAKAGNFVVTEVQLRDVCARRQHGQVAVDDTACRQVEDGNVASQRPTFDLRWYTWEFTRIHERRLFLRACLVQRRLALVSK